MEPVEYNVTQLIQPGTGSCYQIPPFQRNFQWRLEQVHRLIRDIDLAVKGAPHWIGVSLLANASTPCPLKNRLPGHNCFDVLDGQQRLLTLRIWLTALIDEFERQTGQEPVDYPRHQLVDISVHGLDLDEWDRLRTRKILDDRTFTPDGSIGAISRTYWYCRFLLLQGEPSLDGDEPQSVPRDRKEETSLLEYWMSEESGVVVAPIAPSRIVEIIFGTLENLRLTVLRHTEKDESVEIIFETLNSERQPLGQFDLVRNFILIKSSKTGKAQNQLYAKLLLPSESKLANAKLDFRSSNLDRFLYDYLIGVASVVSEPGVSASSLAREFRRMWNSQTTFANVEDFFESDFRPSMYAWLAAVSGAKFVIDGSREIAIPEKARRSIWRIESLSRGPFTPLTARFIRDWVAVGKSRKPKQLIDRLHSLETYAARSLLAGVPFSPMRRTMMQLAHGLFGTNDIDLDEWVRTNSPTDVRIESVLGQSLARNRKDPDPVEWVLEDDFATRATSRQVRAIFDGLTVYLEGDMTKELVPRPGSRERGSNSRTTVEHLYPQNPVAEWEADLRRWKSSTDRMAARLNAIGNITVVPARVNTQLSNRDLAAKQVGLNELGVPLFRITEPFMRADKWTHEEIDARTKSLIKSCLSFWKVQT